MVRRHRGAAPHAEVFVVITATQLCLGLSRPSGLGWEGAHPWRRAPGRGGGWQGRLKGIAEGPHCSPWGTHSLWVSQFSPL